MKNGVGSGSGDPDPHQNVTDPKLWQYLLVPPTNILQNSNQSSTGPARHLRTFRNSGMASSCTVVVKWGNVVTVG
jgi:hypothetical protein